MRLVYTPGHTHGHQSVILRLKDREALVTGDAVYFKRTIEDERRGWVMADEHKWRRSIGEIRLYRRENPDALIIPGHDPEAWAGARPALRVAACQSTRSPASGARGGRPSRRAPPRCPRPARSRGRLAERAEQQVCERLDRLLLDQARVDQDLEPELHQREAVAGSISRQASAPAPTERRAG